MHAYVDGGLRASAPLALRPPLYVYTCLADADAATTLLALPPPASSAPGASGAASGAVGSGGGDMAFMPCECSPEATVSRGRVVRVRVGLTPTLTLNLTLALALTLART